MIGYIIRDYFGAFRVSNFKRGRAAKFIFVPVYFFSMCIVLRQSWYAVMLLLMVFGPLFFSYCSVLVHSPELTKMMYLCPMNPEERKQYIYGSWYFRIAVHMFVAILGLCIVVSNSDCDIFSAVEIFLNQFLVAVMINREQKASGEKSGMVIGEFIFLGALFSNIVQIGIITDANPNLWLKITMLFIFCLVQAPLEVTHLKAAGKVLQAALSFEAISD